jgi:hypothetical protein
MSGKVPTGLVGGKGFALAGIVMKGLLSGELTAGWFCLFENMSDGRAVGIRSRALPRSDTVDLPLSAGTAAGLALQPSFAAVAHVARQKNAAGCRLVRLGGSEKRDRSPRAAMRTFPGLGHTGLTAIEELHGRGLDTAEILVRRRGIGRADGTRDVGVAILAEQASQAVRAAGDRDGKQNRGEAGRAAR